jgi:hypothetical protein
MRTDSNALNLQAVDCRPARALLALQDGNLYLGCRCDIYRCSADDRRLTHITSMPCRLIRRAAGASRLASRLLRHEVKALGVLSNGACVAVDREGVFHAEPGQSLMTRSNVEEAGTPCKPPMTVTVGPNDRVLWGEYNSKFAHNLPIRVFVSDDRGLSYGIARVFEGGDILHIHNILLDSARNHYWLLAGDHDHEPGIGRLSLDLRSFEWLARGKQCYRAVDVFDLGDHLLYATDTEKEPNAIIRLNKQTAHVERLQELPGSGIYSCRFGGLYVVSTSVEPSTVNHRQESTLWVSRDGERWQEVYRAAKDHWHAKYFQFGSIVLPRGASNNETILFSGQALQGIDGRAYVARFTEGREDVGR